ncbi:cap-specific mRNA (nucleoside-2'-O-)-methyltransferase 2-like [Exaiptasia diaphana]|uniref:Cap-specific mRNA (nucleoside-2'-O-)-methyltransferase 1 n=1 Tax=Exaiptasia diaphana TaxID=2652724 RepID=A0A913Y2M1_EXADI|nr:cap-specific mRNA (nucleoside-2'-O-)-methyltransferase 2-like [Exaiptasia diaphana]
MRLAKNGMQFISLFPEDVEWLEVNSENKINFYFAKGKMISNILNSRFCSSYYITKLNTAIENTSITAGKEWKEMSQQTPADACPYCNYYSIIILDHLVKFTQRKGDTSLLLGIPLPCHCIDNYLQSQGVQLQSSHLQSQAVDLVIVPLLDSVPPEYCISQTLELKIKRTLLNTCISTLKVLNPGGTFVCQLYTSLTRFTVSVLYILHCLFKCIAVIKPVVGSLCCPNRFIVCKGYIGFDQDILTSLMKAHDLLVTCQPQEDLLEVIDMKCLYEEKFFGFVRTMNEQLAHVQIVDIVNRESFERDVFNKQTADLVKESMNHFKITVNA